MPNELDDLAQKHRCGVDRRTEQNGQLFTLSTAGCARASPAQTLCRLREVLQTIPLIDTLSLFEETPEQPAA